MKLERISRSKLVELLNRNGGWVLHYCNFCEGDDCVGCPVSVQGPDADGALAIDVDGISIPVGGDTDCFQSNPHTVVIKGMVQGKKWQRTGEGRRRATYDVSAVLVHAERRAKELCRRRTQQRLAQARAAEAHEAKVFERFTEVSVAEAEMISDLYADRPRVPAEDVVVRLRRGDCRIRRGLMSDGVRGEIIVDAELLDNCLVRVITGAGEVTVCANDVATMPGGEMYVFQYVEYSEPKPKRFGGGTRKRTKYGIALKITPSAG